MPRPQDAHGRARGTGGCGRACCDRLLVATGGARRRPSARRMTQTRSGSRASARGPVDGGGEARRPFDLRLRQYPLRATTRSTPRSSDLSAKPAWDDDSLDGAVYGEPLVYDATVYVATENDSVYAIAARSGKVALAPARRDRGEHLGDRLRPDARRGCGDIDPLGITGTPVIDTVAGEIFVAEETELAGRTAGRASGTGSSRSALRATTCSGTGTSTRRTATTPRTTTSPPSSSGRRSRSRTGASTSRSAGSTATAASTTATSSSLPVSGTGPLGTYQVPTQREGAIWETSGAVVSPEGDLYVATGNGSSNQSRTSTRGTRSSSCRRRCSRLGCWAPSNWVQLNDDDWDLGSAGPIDVPGTSLLFVAGKPSSERDDFGYLMSEGHLGGIGHGAFTGAGLPERRGLRRGRLRRRRHAASDAASTSTPPAAAEPRRSRSRRRRWRSIRSGHPSVREPERPADRRGRPGVGARLERRRCCTG